MAGEEVSFEFETNKWNSLQVHRFALKDSENWIDDAYTAVIV